MGAEPQEVRSLPRNRKCGNCRFYEPAPLWRKGWCRNPKLYPPHANHLVDATTIDCEGGFRSRIYWEPLPVVEAPVQEQPATRNYPLQIFRSNNRAEAPAASPERPVSLPLEQETQPRPVVRPTEPAPQRVAPKVEKEKIEPPTPKIIPVTPKVEPVIAEPAPAEPGLVLAEPEITETPGKDWREVVREKAPFTKTWPLERIVFNKQTYIYWGIAGVVLLLVLFMLISNITKKPEVAQPDPVAVQATATAEVALTVRAQATAFAQATAIARPAATPTPSKPVVKTALVKGTGSTPLNVREEASTKAKIVTTIKEGEKLTILEGPKDSEGRGWYRVEYGGKTGWAAKDYLEVQS